MKKRFLFGVVTLLAVYVLLELVSLLLIGVLSGNEESLAEIKGRRRARLPAEGLKAYRGTPAGRWYNTALHPFLGYVNDTRSSEIHDFGFLGDENPFYDDPDVFIVAITGGSVAQNLWKASAKELTQLVETLPEVAGRPVRVICIAMWGYKQPQQLAALNYFLAIGGRLDVLINIDGFNEIANGRNIGAYQAGHIYPAYPTPTVWLPITGSLTTPGNTRLIGEIGVFRSLQRQLARLAEGLGFSASANLIWSLVDQIAENQIMSLQAEASRVSAETRKKSAYFQTGPRDKVAPEEVYAYSADLWFRSSLIMESVARGARISYFHFLQPNQYLPGSKRLVGKEKRVSDPKGIFGRHVATGYPLLQEAGIRLREAGVRFTDLTSIYRNESQTIYIDNCCHVNELGNHLMVERIFEVIRDDFASVPCSHPGHARTDGPSSRTCPRRDEAPKGHSIDTS